MKHLTLNEKITIKGALDYYGVNGMIITKMTTCKTAVHYWSMCSRESIVNLLWSKHVIKQLIKRL